MVAIVDVRAREILDSRGTPTVEAEVTTQAGITGRAAVPSGASTGAFEAVELRDADSDRYFGKGVTQAVRNVNTEIAQTLNGVDVFDQLLIDQLLVDLDGTENKGRLGANATLAVSMAAARAAATQLRIPLYRYLGGVSACIMPMPLMNLINGGKHADNSLDFQEFMIAPVQAAGFREALRMGAEVFQSLRALLKKEKYSVNVGDEGGFAPSLHSHEEALELLMKAIDLAGYAPGEDVCLALDAAANEFFDAESGRYVFHKSGGESLDGPGMVAYWTDLIGKYPIVSIEDGLHEEDWANWEALTAAAGDRVQLVGDDLFVTTVERLERGVRTRAANAILIKPNQIGTLSETMDAARLAAHNAFGQIVSHRSGETEDAFIADLAVALNAGQIKTGSLSRSDRTAKYNQLVRIEEELGSAAIYGGDLFRFARHQN